MYSFEVHLTVNNPTPMEVTHFLQASSASEAIIETLGWLQRDYGDECHFAAVSATPTHFTTYGTKNCPEAISVDA